jgi:hypothetical protein
VKTGRAAYESINPELLRIFRLSVSELNDSGFERVLDQIDSEILLRLMPGSFRWVFRSLPTSDLLLLRQFLESEKQARLLDGMDSDVIAHPVPLWIGEGE